MADDPEFTPFRQHLANVLTDHKEGLSDGLNDAVQAIFDHPEFARAWDAYERDNPQHGMHKTIGGKDAWWNAIEGVWKWEPIKP